MDRSVYNNLIDWTKAQRRKPLLIRGARQVGKTWLFNLMKKDIVPAKDENFGINPARTYKFNFYIFA